MIPFNKPYLTGNELGYIEEAVGYGKISGDGIFSRKCQEFFESTYGFQKCLLTTSCTDALEMAAILINIQAGDEVIIPSYTFVSTANAFVLRGARVVFCDSRADHPGMDENLLEELITEKTKAIIPVHYAGVACDMDKIMSIAAKYNLFVIEDAAQAIDSYYNGSVGGKKPLGSIGQLASFSFHETKNIFSGEGGMLVINDPSLNERAEIIREKGTNRSKFFRGEVDRYTWVDIGSSFLPSDIIAAFLYAQLENIGKVQKKRIEIWEAYWELLADAEATGLLKRPYIPSYATNNGHMFYVVCQTGEIRKALMAELSSHHIMAIFHYISLDTSAFYNGGDQSEGLVNSHKYTERLLRLPFYFELKDEEIKFICSVINSFLTEYGARPTNN